MRSSMTFFMAALAVAACTNDTTPSAPQVQQPPRTFSAGVSDGELAASITKTPDAKPTDQVGFTKVQFITGPLTVANPGNTYSANADCPVGTLLIGGSWELRSAIIGTPPLLTYNNRIDVAGKQRWGVGFNNAYYGADSFAFVATAICIS